MRYVQQGIDPTVADVDLQAKLLKSDLLAGGRPAAPERTVTDRLAELVAIGFDEVYLRRPDHRRRARRGTRQGARGRLTWPGPPWS